MELSIVIPVYNVEQYLDVCMQSVVATPIEDIEIILVDDGSTDSSGKKCDEWATKDARIRVIHKPNGGLMSAWKKGVTAAKGEYVGFVDSDDWIDSDMFPRLLSEIKKHSADMVIGGLMYEYSNGNSEPERTSATPGVYEKDDIALHIFPIVLHDFAAHKRGIPPSRVTKLFKTSLLLQILDLCDEKVSIGEDLLTTFAFVTQMEKLVIIPDFHPYHYRLHDSSMMNKYSPKVYDKIILLTKALTKVAERIPDFDFSSQIDTDFLALTLYQLDCEMLFSQESKRELFQRMKTIYNGELFQRALHKGANKNLSKKQKLYVFFLKHRLYRLLLTVRKCKKTKEGSK